MHPIHTSDAPKPAGHYSQGIVHAGLVYVSGQLPIDPADPAREPDSIEAQTRRTLSNVQAVLEEAGSGLGHVLQLLIYVSDGSDWGTVNGVVAEMFGEYRPSRAIIPVGPLKRGFALEITAIGAIPETT